MLTSVWFSTSSGSTTEGSSSYGTLVVERDGSTSNSLSVNSTLSGTATNFMDYNAMVGGLQFTNIYFASGVSQITITFKADGFCNDTSQEGTETATLTINSGSGYTVGSPSSGSISIYDNDNSPTNITLSNSSIAENQSSPGNE